MKYVVYQEDADGEVSLWNKYDTEEEAEDVASELNYCGDSDTYYWVEKENEQI